MDDRKVGLIARALRRRRGWRQVDLGDRAGVSQAFVSGLERGHVDRTSLHAIRRVFRALDAGVWIEVRWRGGEAERLLDEHHARLVGTVAERLGRLGWEVRTEVTYSEFGERGSFDLIAWHRASGALLVIEVKINLDSAEATLRKLDEKTRLAARVARERFGLHARSVSRVLVLREATATRRRIAMHGALIETALPTRPADVRRWLRAPVGRVDGVWFLPLITPRGDRRRTGGRHRVRCPREAA